MTENIDESVGTQQRLLEAAGEVFAEKGYEKATIRQIVQRAGANLNAVNYYFRDKHGLYLAVFEHAHEMSAERYAAEKAERAELAPDQHLRAFVAGMLRGILAKHERVWPRRLMFREMVDPTGALDLVIEGVIRPRFDEATEIVRRLLGPDVPKRRVQLSAESIVGQCVHLAHAQPVLAKLMPDLRFNAENLDLLVDHITQFSLAALGHGPTKETLE